MKKPCFFFILYSSIALNAKQPENKQTPNIQLPPEIALLKQQHEQRALEQVLNVKNNDKCPCLNFFNKEFTSCMEYAAKEEVRETFTQMNLNARLNYLYQMDLFEYHHFLTSFENEQQWQETLSTLSPDDRKRIPQTLREQLIMIRDTWLECSSNKLGHYARKSKDPEAKDLSAWRNKALEHSAKHGHYVLNYLIWLKGRFLEKKVEVFL